MPPRKHLLLDYGQVICLPQPTTELEQMAALAGLSATEFMQRYWLAREPYDRGGSAEEYWSGVLGGSPNPQQLARLAALDTAAWMHLDPVVVELLDQLHGEDVPVSLLSNAPHELARELRGHAVFAPFAHLMFSAELELTKPDPRIYDAAIARLAVPAADIVFVDDRAENVRAANAHGIEAILYEGHQSLDSIRTAVAGGNGGG